MKRTVLLVCIILPIFHLKVQSQLPNISINELLTSNSTINSDPDFNEFGDWIEIFNNTGSDINLKGYFISDDFDEPAKWKINKEFIINSKQYLIIWCDNKDTILQALHTNFKLNQEKEKLALFSNDLSFIDSISFANQKTNISFGKNPVINSIWEFYNKPTPGKENGNTGYLVSALPVVSLESGYYEVNQKLYILSNDSAITIRYTLDGTDPTVDSDLFPDTLYLTDRSSQPNVYSEIRTNKDPFGWLPNWIPPSGKIFKATVVKIRSFEEGKIASDVVTKTYFIKNGMKYRYSLPVLSIVTDPKNLFDEQTGFYVPGVNHVNGNSNTGNYFKDWEKEVHLTYFEPDGKIGFSQNVGITIQGGTSPASPQKAFHVIARKEYGNNRIDYPIFKNTKGHAKDIKEYKRFIIRAWGSSVIGAMFDDALSHRIMEESDLDLQSYQPMILFINGEYWGLHELREDNKSNWYYEVHHNIDADDPGIDLIAAVDRTQNKYKAKEGDTIQWHNVIKYILNNDMTQNKSYDYVENQIDVDNFIDYMAHAIYAGRWDWPGNNEAIWRPRTDESKWRYIPYDFETGFGLSTALGPSYNFLGVQINMFDLTLHGTQIPLYGIYGPHLVFKELVKNNEFVNSFIANMKDKLQNEFSVSSTTAILNEMVDQIEPYLQEHWERWPYLSNLIDIGWLKINWETRVGGIRDYLEKRPDYLSNQLEEFRKLYAKNTAIEGFINNDRFKYFIKIARDLPNYQNISLQIYTIDGKLFQQKQLSKQDFISYFNNLGNSNIPKGVYITVIRVGKDLQINKIVVF